ncbi:hemerythrin domain-containing protein [Alicycliphilus denitrificans]|uniref:hemerythrin domain-containing protein n=1 Tax=Alicycliphilus denitrificans TaxID=179636 RepID=UPI0038508DA2
MAALQWSDELALDLPPMDDTHREFVALLQAVEDADDASLIDAWRRLVAHTEAHFGQEDRWMQATRFAAGNCHSAQHQMVLKIMRGGTDRGEPAVLRAMAAELAVWFPRHTDAMDAALAQHLRAVGFDPATGTMRTPEALPAELIHGCGGACSSGDDATPVEAVVAA